MARRYPGQEDRHRERKEAADHHRAVAGTTVSDAKKDAIVVYVNRPDRGKVFAVYFTSAANNIRIAKMLSEVKPGVDRDNTLDERVHKLDGSSVQLYGLYVTEEDVREILTVTRDLRSERAAISRIGEIKQNPLQPGEVVKALQTALSLRTSSKGTGSGSPPRSS